MNAQLRWSLRCWTYLLLVSWISCCICTECHKNPCLVMFVPALHPSGVAKSSTSFGWGKGWNVASGGWQVTLCDPIWHVSSSSGVATSVSELLYPCYFTLHLVPSLTSLMHIQCCSILHWWYLSMCNTCISPVNSTSRLMWYHCWFLNEKPFFNTKSHFLFNLIYYMENV